MNQPGKLGILVVEDDPAVRFGVRDFLESKGFEVLEAADRVRAEEVYREAQPDAVILDFLLPDGETLDLMARLKALNSGVPILILTAHGSIDLAVRAIKEGADHFLTKPVDLSSLLVLLHREIDASRSRRKGLARERREARSEDIDPFMGSCPASRELEEQAGRILNSDSLVLIQGETGTGKGVLARWLHAHGPRAGEPFVDVNCAGLSRELLESELFGHEKGSFTGAQSAKPGLLEIGDKGTVFLDEIGDMDLQIQPKLLTVLEDKRFRRLGDVRDRKVDIRLIAATNQDLAQLVREKKFRSDLYFRINAITLTVPPLRRRKEAIVPLARSILQSLAKDVGRSQVKLSPEAESALLSYVWPGNIRELRNVLERAVLLSSNDTLLPKDLRFEGNSPESAAEIKDLTLSEVERLHIERVLAEEGGHVERAALRLGLARSSLYYKIKRFGLSSSES